MKKLLAIVLCLVFCLSLVACGGNTASDSAKVAKYVNENKDELVSAMESSFSASSSMGCEVDVNAVGNGMVIDVNIAGFDNIPDEQKELLQSTYDAMSSTFETMLDNLQSEVPEFGYITINVNEEDGDNLATINAGK
ncbi:MAG: DUF4854 domain-containing protein [Clostridia bacterium]|nr:DUF4854 domain-containing protein [Clostridia bacterium]